jgi:hypothetical protein
MNTTIVQPASQQQRPKPIGRVLARTLAENLSQPSGFVPHMTQTIYIGGLRDTDIG